MMMNIPSRLAKQRIKHDLNYLCHSDLQGRLSGTEGAKKAAQFLANRFSELGYSPFRYPNFFQPVSVPATRLLGQVSLIIGEESFVHRRDFGEFLNYSSGGEVEGKLIIIHDGSPIREEDLPSSIVFIPQRPEGFDVQETIKTAIEYGVKALLVEYEDPKWFRKSLFGSPNNQIPVLRIRTSLASKIEKLAGSHAEIKLPVQYEIRECQNVIGFIPGTNSKQTIVLSAHYDHLGDDPGGNRFEGAIDNASGVAMMLEVAKRIQQIKSLPFNLVFAFFTGEESGLHGAKQFAEKYRDEITAVINVDCIGQESAVQSIRIGCKNPSYWLPQLVSDSVVDLPLDIKWNDYAGDDSIAFRKSGIPAVGIGQMLQEHSVSIHTPDDLLKFVHTEALVTWVEIILRVIENLRTHLSTVGLTTSL